MWPRNGFVCCEHTIHDVGSPVWKVRGADVSMIAFLPRALPACDLGAIDDVILARQLRGLFAEGSDPPPASFTGPDAFLAALRGREHRGALAIVEPTVFIDRDERIARVEMRILGPRVGAGFVRRTTGVSFGTGAAIDKKRFQVSVEERSVRIEHWQRFWLHSAEDMAGRYVGAEQAALAWLAITYVLHVDGAAQAWCASSHLPSVWTYRDHVRVHRHEIEHASESEALAVLRPKRELAGGTVRTGVDVSTGCVSAVP